MTVSHLGGTVECKTIEELNFLMSVRYGTGVNEYWIPSEGFPCLAVLVNNEHANLTYFHDEEHSGLQSVGVDTKLDPKESSIFYTNTPTEEVVIRNEAVVPSETAQRAAIEYFSSLSLPTCIDWVEL